MSSIHPEVLREQSIGALTHQGSQGEHIRLGVFGHHAVNLIYRPAKVAPGGASHPHLLAEAHKFAAKRLRISRRKLVCAQRQGHGTRQSYRRRSPDGHGPDGFHHLVGGGAADGFFLPGEQPLVENDNTVPVPEKRA